MKTIAKRLAALALALLLPLTGCAGEQMQEPDPAEVEPHIVIGFSQLGAESDWRVANTESIRSTFTEEKGYELIYSDAQQKQENQFTAIRRFIQQGVDYILLAPLTETGWDSVLKEARAAGIPVILVDRSVFVADDTLFTAMVGSNFYEEGQQAVAWMATAESAAPLRIVHMLGTLGSTAQVGRTKALLEGLDAHPAWQLTAKLDGNFTQAKGYESMRDFLKTNKQFDLIYCENDNMALGVLQALHEAGIYPEKGDVQLISFDATHQGLAACLSGEIALDVECDPLQGRAVEKVIRELEAGQTPEKYYYMDTTCFTPQNVTQILIDSRAY